MLTSPLMTRCSPCAVINRKPPSAATPCATPTSGSGWPPWAHPEAALQQAQFFEALQACVGRLPPKVGRVFMMREWLEQEVDDICAELAITSNNCGVMLYRARMQLRECLDRNWFQVRA